MKKPEHPCMLGKTNEEILADAKPLIDEIKGFSHDSEVVIFKGSQPFTGEEFYEEVIHLTPFGRAYISAYHYGIDRARIYQAKKIAALKKIQMIITWSLLIAGILLLTVWCSDITPTVTDLSVKFVTLILFIAIYLLFSRKSDELLKVKRMVF